MPMRLSVVRIVLSGLPFVSFVSLMSLVPARAAHAQVSDAVGVRAQGMNGAFTALADDSTATWWHPAGLASGAYFNAIVEYGRQTDKTAGIDRDLDHRGVSVAFPALGLSYYRLTVSEIRPVPSTASSTASRQDPG